MTNLQRVTALVGNVSSDDMAVLARCQLALSVAAKLDDAVSDPDSRSQTAVATLAKELRAAIDDISGVEGRKESLMAEVFSV